MVGEYLLEPHHLSILERACELLDPLRQAEQRHRADGCGSCGEVESMMRQRRPRLPTARHELNACQLAELAQRGVITWEDVHAITAENVERRLGYDPSHTFEHDLSSLLRAGAGRPQAEPAELEPSGVGSPDGGVRPSPPAPGPDVNRLIRAAIRGWDDE